MQGARVETQSEKWFEEFCAKANIACKRVAVGNGKTPDYELTINGQCIIAEVKEITRNRGERQSDRLLSERGYGEVLHNTPGDRVRKKIADSSPQIRALAKERCPSILVLCDIQHGCGQVSGHLSRDDIRVAMYGLEQMHITVPQDRSARPYASGMSYGPKRKMTSDANTAISAVGVLSTPGPNNVVLHIYHNKHARIPLSPDLLAPYEIDQYALEAEAADNMAKWHKLGSNRGFGQHR